MHVTHGSKSLYLDQIKAGPPFPRSRAARFRLSKPEEKNGSRKAVIDFELPETSNIELMSIHPDRYK